jgi:hypothetical protein
VFYPYLDTNGGGGYSRNLVSCLAPGRGSNVDRSQYPESLNYAKTSVDDFHAAVIHQATGMVVVQAGVSPSMALLLLVTFAEEAGLPVDAVARDVVNRVRLFDVKHEDHTAK